MAMSRLCTKVALFDFDKQLLPPLFRHVDIFFSASLIFSDTVVNIVNENGRVFGEMHESMWNARGNISPDVYLEKYKTLKKKHSSMSTWDLAFQDFVNLYMNKNIVFVHVVFSLQQDAIDNNLACVVPVVQNNSVACAQHPWLGAHMENGRSWMHSNKSVVRPTPNSRLDFVRLLDNFENRGIIMTAGCKLIEPFCTVRRRQRELRPDAREMIQHQNMYTFLSMLYGLHVNIGISHDCLSSSLLPIDLVTNILYRCCSWVGKNHKWDWSTKSIFLQALSLAVSELDLGHNSYRKDQLGEDIGWHQVHGAHSELTISTPLCGSGDCEDRAQFLIQVYNTVREKYRHILQMVPAEAQEYSQMIIDVFGSIGRQETRLYIARGIYYQSSTKVEENHTFCVSMHTENENHTRLCIVESVLPTIICR